MLVFRKSQIIGRNTDFMHLKSGYSGCLGVYHSKERRFEGYFIEVPVCRPNLMDLIFQIIRSLIKSDGCNLLDL